MPTTLWWTHSVNVSLHTSLIDTESNALKYVFNVYKLYIFNPYSVWWYCWYSACFCIETGEVLCHTAKNYLHSVQHFHDIICQKHDLMSLILSLCIISHVWKHTQFVDLPTVLTTNKCNSTIHFTVSSSHAVQNRSQTAINVLTVTITTPICALTTHLAYDKLWHDST